MNTLGTGAAGLSYDDIRSLRIPILPAEDQAAVRRAFMRMHAAHVEAAQKQIARIVSVRIFQLFGCPIFDKAIRGHERKNTSQAA